MSMGSLSTELDDNIIKRLPQSALNSISKTSKYYRSLAEPSLYENVVLAENETVAIICLFRTLLDRKHLAKHLKSFTFEEREAKDVRAITRDHYATMLAKSEELKDVLQGITATFRDPEFTRKWLSSALDISSKCDGTLALILCLATNIERVSLGSLRDRAITNSVLGARWVGSSDTAPTYPFCKLRTLELAGGSGCLLPSMETFQISDIQAVAAHPGFEMPYSEVDITTNLQIVHLRGAFMTASWFEEAIASRQWSNIKELRLIELGNTNRPHWSGYDFSRINQALAAHISGLRVFEWSNHLYEKQYSQLCPFGSFKALAHLKELTLDLDLMTPIGANRAYDRVLHIAHSQEYLLAGLESLHITQFKLDKLEGMFKHFGRDVIADYLTGKTAALHLRQVELSVEMEDWDYDEGNGTCELPRRLRQFIPEIIALLAEQGTTLKIWRQKSRFAGKLLYAPGYAAAWPHWGDVDRRFWSDEAQEIFDVKTGRKPMPGHDPYRDWEWLVEEVKDVDED